MVSSINNMSAVLLSMSRSSGGGIDIAGLFAGQGSGQTFSPATVTVALKQAEKHEDKQIAQVKKDPIVQRELARYEKVVKEAKTVDEVLSDPIARKVFMKANGLGSYVDQVGLAKKAITSNPQDPDSVAAKLSGINGAWLSIAKTYNFPLFGTAAIKTTTSLEEIKTNYAAEVRLDQLDQQMPGLGSAILFKKSAAKLDNAIKILGNPLGREVVTTALGLPKQLAFQSLEAQQKAILKGIDPSKLKDEAYVDRVVQRYLVRLNGGSSGVTA